jgi:hypothetical protein
MLASILMASMLAATTVPPPAVVKGFGLSPRGFPLDYSQLPAFYAEVASMPGGGAMWNGLWRDEVAGAIPVAARAVLESSATYRYTPVVVFGWRSGTVTVPASWSDSEARALFMGMLRDFATAYQPPFVFLGNENDFHYERNPTDYATWIAVYNAAYDAIKAASPSTTVGPVFSYEHLAGSGALNGWTTSFWPALEMHDMTRVDVVGITVYPFLNFATASSVPAGYLDPLLTRIGSKPIAITETGWPAEDHLNAPWEASESAQVTYLSRLAAMLRGRRVRMVNHLFLHAMQNPGGSPFEWKFAGSISLRDASGSPRPAYDAWLALLGDLRRRAVGH